MSGRSVLAPETGKAHLSTVYRRTGGTARRWEAEDHNRCLDVMSARRVKHDCRYPSTVPCRVIPRSKGVRECKVDLV